MQTSTRFRDRSLAAEETILAAFRFENETAIRKFNQVGSADDQ
jgi:hypothetical protein